MVSVIGWILIVACVATALTLAILTILWQTGVLFRRKRVGRAPKATDESLAAPRWSSLAVERAVAKTAPTSVLIASAGPHVLTVDPKTLDASVHSEDYEARPVGRITRDAALSDSGAVAYVTEVGSVVIDGTQTVVIPGFAAHAITFDGPRLWIAALDANRSGHLFMWTDGALKPSHTVTPQGGSRNADNFGFAMHVSGAYMIVSHPLDRTAHVYRRESDADLFMAHSIVEPRINTSMFPYAVSISADGMHVLLADPTDTVQQQPEAGSVHAYVWDGKSAYVPDTVLSCAEPQPYARFGNNMITQARWAIINQSVYFDRALVASLDRKCAVKSADDQHLSVVSIAPSGDVELLSMTRA